METKSAGSREKVRRLVQEIPELGAVQDADRLGAIGGVRIGGTFMYGGAAGKAGQKGRGMQETIEHFTDRLERFGGLTKRRQRGESGSSYLGSGWRSAEGFEVA